jgi:putative FmdB family regulatory protein
VATYAYRCADCGPFEVARPIGTAEAAGCCPRCGGPARRVYTPPLLRGTPSAVSGMRDAADRSADQPTVVNRVPTAHRKPAPAADPRQAGLPRP